MPLKSVVYLPEAQCSSHDATSNSFYWIQPPLSCCSVPPVEVVVKPAAGVEFLAAEAIDVGVGQGAVLAQQVALRIVKVTRRQGLLTRHWNLAHH